MLSQEWWRGAVLYQVYPRSFSDSNGDGVGDLAGVIDHLDYIASLGVDGIWLSPFFRSPMRDFGYDVSDYLDVDPLFGDLETFDRLVNETHRRGLKLIIDQVYSHTSDDHAWFAESRIDRENSKSDWYVWADARPDGLPPNNWLSMFGGPAWTWDTRRRQYYLHNFLKSQPDLNFHNLAVQDAILDVARFWLMRGVDGFRLDVANFYMHDRLLRDNPPSGRQNATKPYAMQLHQFDRSQPECLAFFKRLRAVLDEAPAPERMTLAEIASDQPSLRIREYTGENSALHSAYSFAFLTERFDAGLFRDTLQETNESWPCWAFSNHDAVRVATRWHLGLQREHWLRSLIVLLTTLRGSACLYQGEELGLLESDIPLDQLVDPDGVAFWPGYKGRDGCRTPMPWQADSPDLGFGSSTPWLPIDEQHRPLAVDRQQKDPDSLLNFVRGWLSLRRQFKPFSTGRLGLLPSKEGLLAFERYEEGVSFYCVFNLQAATSIWDIPNGIKLESLIPLGGELSGRQVRLPGGASFLGLRQNAPTSE